MMKTIIPVKPLGAIQPDRHLGVFAWCAALPGTMLRGACVPLSAAGLPLALVTIVVGSAAALAQHPEEAPLIFEIWGSKI